MMQVMKFQRMKLLRDVRAFSSIPKPVWAASSPDDLGKGKAHKLSNLVNGEWKSSQKYWTLIDPMDGNKEFILMPDTQVSELQPFIDSMKRVPKSGLHNPMKNVDRYNKYAEVAYKTSVELSKPEVEQFFIRAIQRVMPKSEQQCKNEVVVTNTFLKTFSGDSVRFMARGFNVTGDHDGQESKGYRWPLGATAIIAPFNFPFEIPVLQLMGALFMGNKVVIKGSEKTSYVLEEYIRLLHYCGMPKEDLDLIHCHGASMEHLLVNSPVRLTQFTGSAKVAEHLMIKLKGKLKIEDAGFDWKILGPDLPPKTGAGYNDIDFIAYTCDQDAYAMSGQKCSAQSILFMHENYEKAGFVEKLKKQAAKRSLKNNTISPVLSFTNDQYKKHLEAVLKVPGAKLLFGELLSKKEQHSIPEIYGSFTPTAVFVPIDSMLANEEAFKLCTTEIFGPFQIITSYKDNEVDKVLECCERMSHHLTAALVSNDQKFLYKVLGNTVNGTTYAGFRARTTGAPTNHWFGPAGDPRGAGIGTPEAIQLVWSCHREIIKDYLLPASYATEPKQH